jgi:tetratricopeptide (TPR) repeat protein
MDECVIRSKGWANSERPLAVSWLSVVVAAIVALGCAEAPTPKKRHLAKETAPASSNLQPPADIRDLKKRLAAHPEDPDLQNAMGLELFRRGNAKDASQYFKNAIDILEGIKKDPAFTDDMLCVPALEARYINYAHALATAELYEEALAALKAATESVKSPSYELWHEAIAIQMHLGRKYKAAREYAAASAATRIFVPMGNGPERWACITLGRKIDAGLSNHDALAIIPEILAGPERRAFEEGVTAAELFIETGHGAEALTIIERTNYDSQYESLETDRRKALIRALARVKESAKSELAHNREDEARNAATEAAKELEKKQLEPSYWADQLVPRIRSLADQINRINTRVREGWATQAHEQLWPHLVADENDLCDAIGMMKQHLETGSIDEVLRLGTRKVALSSGDQESGAFSVLARKYVAAERTDCPQFSRSGWPGETAGDGKTEEQKRKAGRR